MQAPLVSILVPVFNRESLVEATLASALAQTHRDIEVVVVDNCSTDRTWQVVQAVAAADPRVVVFRNERNLGPVGNWLRCVERARGRYAKFLWSDDLIESEFVAETLAALEANADCGFAYCSTRIFDAQGEACDAYRAGPTGKYPTSEFIRAHLCGGAFDPPLSPGNALFRRTDLQRSLLADVPNEAGVDCARTGAGIDVLMYLLCAKEYPSFYFIDRTLARFRVHAGSFTAANDLSASYLVAKIHFAAVHCREGAAVRDKFFTWVRLRHPRFMPRRIAYRFDVAQALKMAFVACQSLLAQLRWKVRPRPM